MAVDVANYLNNLQNRLQVQEHENTKIRNRLVKAEQRISALESDVAELLGDAGLEPEAEPKVEHQPTFAIKRRFQGKFAVQDKDSGELLTGDMSLAEAQAKLAELRAN